MTIPGENSVRAVLATATRVTNPLVSASPAGMAFTVNAVKLLVQNTVTPPSAALVTLKVATVEQVKGHRY